MIEIVIDCWKAFDGSREYIWSVWHDGRRVRQGSACTTPDEAEGDSIAFCRGQLGAEPDRVTRL